MIIQDLGVRIGVTDGTFSDYINKEDVVDVKVGNTLQEIRLILVDNTRLRNNVFMIKYAEVTSPAYGAWEDFRDWFTDIMLTGTSGASNSRVAYIDTVNPTNGYAHIFKTKADADAYLAGLTGADAPTTNNHWCIEFGAGYIDEDCVAYPYVDLLLKPGTVLKSLVSAVPYDDYNAWDCRVFGGAVKLLSVAEGMVIAFESCSIEEIQPVEGDGKGYVHIEDCWVLGGDLSNILQPLSGWNNTRLVALKSALSGLSGICLVNGIVAKTETFGVADLPSTMIGGCISAAGVKVLEGTTTKLYGTNVLGAIEVEAGAALKLHPGTYCTDVPVPLDPSASIVDYRFVVPQYADNAAASAAGLVVGSMYWNTTSSATSIVV